MMPTTAGGLVERYRTETQDFTNTQKEVKHSPRCMKNGDTTKQSNRDSGADTREVGVLTIL
tara:strand:+ start:34 stop:216 length:183 start_codon:yes stop_codon:yes gene_type:complete